MNHPSHPSHSSDTVPFGHHLLRSLAHSLKGCHFLDEDQLKTDFQSFLDRKSPDFPIRATVFEVIFSSWNAKCVPINVDGLEYEAFELLVSMEFATELIRQANASPGVACALTDPRCYESKVPNDRHAILFTFIIC
ncbi:hypothetical protein RB195_010838 [Necator americanus]|uniref:Queuosine salvage protein n=1 Tax=Necator americanus TaxID=51031 RepID=A0ABR1CZT3_NECAM